MCNVIIIIFQLGLLDFGATREYRPFFVNNYFKIIDGAAKGDRDQILEYSRKIGFLTGYESKVLWSCDIFKVDCQFVKIWRGRRGRGRGFSLAWASAVV